MTYSDAQAVYAEMCALWPKSPRTENLDARRLDRLERLEVSNCDGVSAADRCCDRVNAYYERLMSESKTPRTTVPFDAIDTELRKLEDRMPAQPAEAVDSEAGEVVTPPHLLADWYEKAATRADARAESAPNDGRLGDPKFWRSMAGVCRRRAAKCRQDIGGTQ